MSLFRKSPLSRTSGPAKHATPVDQLRSEIAAMEKETLESQRGLNDLEIKMREVEARTIEAIRRGDDRAARDSLLEQRSLAEKAVVLAADLKVLRALLDECYEFLSAR